MRLRGTTFAEMDLILLEDEFAYNPAMDEAAVGLSLFGQAARLKIFVLLRDHPNPDVNDISRILALPVHEVSGHLAVLRAFHLLESRERGCHLCYSLTDHPLNGAVQAALSSLTEGPE